MATQTKKTGTGMQGKATDTEATAAKISTVDKLFNGGRVISVADYEALAEHEKEELQERIVEKLNTWQAAGDKKHWQEFDKLYRLCKECMRPHLKEYMLSRINKHVMHTVMKLSWDKTMPHIDNVAGAAGLSVSVVSEALKENKEYFAGDGANTYALQAELLKNVVFNKALSGDLQAAKLFFVVTGTMNATAAANTNIITQHNTLNLNGHSISPDELQSLPPNLQGIIANMVAEQHIHNMEQMMKPTNKKQRLITPTAYELPTGSAQQRKGRK